MSDTPRIRIVFDEDKDIVDRIMAIARAEGISRSDVLRRAIRRLVFSSPAVPDFGDLPKEEDAVAA